MANDKTTEKQNVLEFTTPKGEAKYPHLNEPDYKFNDDGEYNCKLFMAEDGQVKLEGEIISIAELEKRLDAEYESAIKAGKKGLKAKGTPPNKLEATTKPWGWNDPTDDDGNVIERTDEDGPRLFYVSAKMRASGTSKKTGKPYEMRPALFDCSKPKPKVITTTCPQIGNGSILRLGLQAAPFLNGTKAGITLRLQSAQVIEIKNEGGRDAEHYGFDGEDGGFEGEEGKPERKPAAGKKRVEMDDEDENEGPSDSANGSDDGDDSDD